MAQQIEALTANPIKMLLSTHCFPWDLFFLRSSPCLLHVKPGEEPWLTRGPFSLLLPVLCMEGGCRDCIAFNLCDLMF